MCTVQLSRARALLREVLSVTKEPHAAKQKLRGRAKRQPARQKFPRGGEFSRAWERQGIRKQRVSERQRQRAKER